jgi:branched-chain amino acid transport system substrate-binding protein
MLSILLLTSLLLVGCQSNEKIKVAYVAGITGNLSELGIYGRNAFLLKVNEVNNNGGIDGRLIEPVIYDDLNDPGMIEEIYFDIRENDIEFVVGHILSALAEPVLIEAESDDVLIFSPTMSTQLIDNFDDNLIRSCTSNSLQGQKMASIVSLDQRKSVLVVTDQRNATYSNEFAETYRNHYEGATKIIQYLPDDGSIETVLTEIESGNYDALIMVTPALDTALLSQKTKLMDESMNLYSVSWSMTSDLIANGGQHVEGLKLVYQNTDVLYKNESEKFYDAYFDEYNEKSNFVGEITYEATAILFEAMSESSSLTPENVKKNIINRTFEGLSGLIEINEFGDRPGIYSTYIVEEGEFIQID